MKPTKWASTSVQELLRAHPGCTDPEAIIVSEARALVAEARSVGWSGPPFDMEELASVRGIAVKEDTAGYVAEAVLEPAGEIFEIKYNPEKSLERIRFSTAHEIAHTFFPDCAEVTRYRPQLPQHSDEVEALCDLGASELLLPAPSFSQDLQALGGLSLEAIAELRGRYEASWEATANAAVKRSDLQVAMIVLSLCLKPSEQCGGAVSGVEKLRVEYAITSPSFDFFMPKHKSIPDDSVLYGAIETSDVVSSTEAWNLTTNSQAVRLHVQGREIPGLGRKRVLALVTPAS